MRRHVIAVLLVLLSVVGAACSKSSRNSARADFVQQLTDEGGLPPEVAQCVADRFFAERTDQELKEFFARKELTEPESAEFQQLGTDCLAEAGITLPTT
ncbi:MAG: hypothetical protein ACOYMR_06950 [Ilumatobacteraceae bacterium]